MDKSSLLDIIEPKANSTILIYDVHASESGALAILDDLYIQIKDYPDKSIKWVFAVSTPYYQNTDTITVLRYSWVKKNWGYRLFFDNITTRKILRKYCPDKVFSLQNKGISFLRKNNMSICIFRLFLRIISLILRKMEKNFGFIKMYSVRESLHLYEK